MSVPFANEGGLYLGCCPHLCDTGCFVLVILRSVEVEMELMSMSRFSCCEVGGMEPSS